MPRHDKISELCHLMLSIEACDTGPLGLTGSISFATLTTHQHFAFVTFSFELLLQTNRIFFGEIVALVMAIATADLSDCFHSTTGSVLILTEIFWIAAFFLSAFRVHDLMAHAFRFCLTSAFTAIFCRMTSES